MESILSSVVESSSKAEIDDWDLSDFRKVWMEDQDLTIPNFDGPPRRRYNQIAR
jgi:hypothetical protein